MSILKKFAILFLICILCDSVVFFLPFSFPGNVLSMVVLFICLFFGLIKVRHIESASDFMLKNMAFFFIPVTASIVSYADVLKSILWQFVFICVVTTVITFVCTAYSVKLTIYLMNKFKRGQKNG